MSAHFAERAVEIALLERSNVERAGAEEHAAGCATCARALETAQDMMTLLGELPPPPPPDRAVTTRIASEVERDLALERLDRRLAPAAVLVAWGLFVALAKHRAGDARSWGESTVVLTLALACSLFARGSKARAVTAGSVAASAALVLLASTGGSLAAALGVKCLVIELVAAFLPFACVLYVARKRGASAPPARLAAVAAAGALAGQAALHLSCAARHDTLHLAVFHFGGVVLAAMLAAAAAPLSRKRERAS